ncbi:MAG: 1-acyl-sn-glycerol-3-phosphate acyltransferase [Candidatus Obscuribacterales bacterium]|nr:1-acyl-sn-glycerol-3-phosphate acyltransferase [Candidatus Obscuribacterales bacterium]
MHSFLTPAVVTALAVSSLIAILFLPRILGTIARAREYARKMQESGYLPPPPTDRGQRRLLRLARLITFIQVGRLEIRGKEKLENIPGAFMVTPNHPHYADLAVMPLVLQRKARYMAAKGVMTAFGGWGGVLAGPMGGFAADLTPGKGGAARETAVRIMTDGSLPLVLFPEGWTYLDGSGGPYKKGAVRIVKAAASETGKETYLLPVHLEYGKYPGKWITKLNPRLEYLLMLLLFWNYRRGCTITIGKPIAASELPKDDAEATEMLRQRILSLKPKR